MSAAKEIYWKAAMKARKEHARMVRQFIKGKLDVCPGGMDMERDAIIKAFEKALGEKNG